jgi:hypothetical protein
MKPYPKDKYVLIERRVGEILVVTGVLLILIYELYSFFLYLKSDAFHFNSSVFSIGLIVSGLAILLISVFREQLFADKRQRYKDVEK